MSNPVWALPAQDGGVVMAAETLGLDRARVYLDLVGVSRDGNVKASFRHAPKTLRLPFLGGSWPASAVPVTVATNNNLIAVVSSTADGKGLKLVQVRG